MLFLVSWRFLFEPLVSGRYPPHSSGKRRFEFRPLGLLSPRRPETLPWLGGLLISTYIYIYREREREKKQCVIIIMNIIMSISVSITITTITISITDLLSRPRPAGAPLASASRPSPRELGRRITNIWLCIYNIYIYIYDINISVNK